jgi:hypothetical protein
MVQGYRRLLRAMGESGRWRLVTVPNDALSTDSRILVDGEQSLLMKERSGAGRGQGAGGAGEEQDSWRRCRLRAWVVSCWLADGCGDEMELAIHRCQAAPAPPGDPRSRVSRIGPGGLARLHPIPCPRALELRWS